MICDLSKVVMSTTFKLLSTHYLNICYLLFTLSIIRRKKTNYKESKPVNTGQTNINIIKGRVWITYRILKKASHWLVDLGIAWDHLPDTLEYISTALQIRCYMCTCALYAVVRTQQSSKAHVGSLSKKLYPYCLVLVGSRNGFKHDSTIKLK